MTSIKPTRVTTPHSMRLVTHEDDKGIPDGMAAICLDDNGWVGTNNGYPIDGQPALFPEAQARALCVAWNGVTIKGRRWVPHPECVSDEVWAWFGLIFDPPMRCKAPRTCKEQGECLYKGLCNGDKK